MNRSQFLWYVLPVSGVTQEIMNNSIQSSLYTARRTTDGSEVLLSFPVHDIPVVVFKNHDPIEHDSVFDELEEPKWN